MPAADPKRTGFAGSLTTIWRSELNQESEEALVLRFEFPSRNFANDCDNAVRAGEAFEIVVYAGSGKINSVRRSIAEMRGERGQIYQISSLFWDKPRTMA